MRILGIDIGSTSIKAVELDSAFGRFEIHEYHEQKVEAGADPALAIARLIESLPKRPDRMVINMRTSQTTFRNFELPTRKKKEIQAAVANELEDELPFDLDLATFDYAVLGQSQAGTSIHATASLKKYVSATLELPKRAGLDPDVLTTEAWAFKTLFSRVLSSPQAAPASVGAPVLYVHLGHEKSTLYVHSEGAPTLVRELNWGGRDLTLAISQKYGIPLDQAESAKLDHGFVLSAAQRGEATPEQTDFSDTLMRPVQNLIWNIRQAELSCKNIAHQNVGTIYVSGGTSLLPGLTRVIEEHLHIPVKPLHALSALANSASGVTYSEQTDVTFCVAAALALTLVGPDRSAGINLRKGEFAKKGQTTQLDVSTLRKPLMSAAAIAFSLFLSVIIQSSVYKSRLKDTNSQLEKSLRTFFGQLSSGATKTYLSNPTSLRNSINKELGKQRELNRLVSANPRSPLNYLKELSSRIPKDTVVDMTQYTVGSAPDKSFLSNDEGAATLSFMVSNPQMAEKLATQLEAKPFSLARGKMDEVSAPDGTKRWKITFTGKASEEAYGK